MNISDFTAEYELKADDELLCLYADRKELVPEAVAALENEVRRRGLKLQNADRTKRRMERLTERKGSLADQVVAAKYERNMRHFDGAVEPAFESPYGQRDPRRTFGSIRHRYRVWKTFRDHTGRWPVLSIWYHFLSWVTVLVLMFVIVTRVETGEQKNRWSVLVTIGAFLVLLGIRYLGARLARKLDWERCRPKQ